jgi:hypothetical protein
MLARPPRYVDGRLRAQAPLGRQIEPGAGRAVLDLNDPNIGIKRDFPFETSFRLAGIDRFSTMRPNKHPLDAGRRLNGRGLRRRTIERRAPIQMVDLHENGAGFGRAPATEDRARSLHSASTQIGGDPNVRAQAQTDLALRSARSHGELLDQSWGYLSRERQAMGAFEITQGLLGCGALISVRPDGIAKSDERGLGGEGQTRPVGASLLTQKIRDRIPRP